MASQAANVSRSMLVVARSVCCVILSRLRGRMCVWLLISVSSWRRPKCCAADGPKRSTSVSRSTSAIAANAELKSHIAAGDNLVLRDPKGNITPAESGAVVVMDVRTGEIVSLVSAPMYDPNIFTEKLAHAGLAAVE